MKRKNFFNYLILVSVCSIFLTTCAPKPGPNLSYNACLFSQNPVTKEEILKQLGPPTKKIYLNDKEEWYYTYHVKTILSKFWFITHFKNYTETLKLTIKDGKVIDVKYYTTLKD